MDEVQSIEGSLRGLAYRMLGSMSEAEDVIQEAWVRFLPRKEEVTHPAAFFRKTVVHLCLDRLKSAARRRVDYVGEFLPEPVLQEGPGMTSDQQELAADIGFGLLMTLEKLTPAERAAFLLREVFDIEYDEIATILGQNEANCRQLAHRARKNLSHNERRTPAAAIDYQQLAQAFFGAIRGGSRKPIEELLARDAVLYSDGGGKRPTALRPIYGAEKIARYFEGVNRRWPPRQLIGPAWLNGDPGLILRDRHGHLFAICISAALDENGTLVVDRIYIQKNPDKLGAIQVRYDGAKEGSPEV